MLIDLVARVLHRSLSSSTHNTTTIESDAAAAGGGGGPTPQQPAVAMTEAAEAVAVAVARHLSLFARLLPGAPHVRAFVWEVGNNETRAFFCFVFM